ncbi:hypothetical protein DBR11_28290 [Pedobacter sp. HMWF019]|uniref:DUF2752 domain-containing protein n=1 Tax=Pedobacter sp. HMWF019 TaxID=2056856 RepID=UPI000D3641AB|nr:DUF2752 domain-containing protein [Pedobacter sp. HMWF019]PTS91859.1 hypothetical protein DBR11_28290 [Pedobacter sp. HMWF019]
MQLLGLYILSAWTSFLGKADNFFLPCPLKQLTGYDCPGCGFQRSLLALLKGDFKDSLSLYPPTVPILFTIVIALCANYGFKNRSNGLIRILYMITGSIILVNYIFKIYSGRLV